MRRYSRYKDSGVDWVGEIPTGWEIKRIGSVTEERRETVSDVDYVPLSVTKNGVLPQMEGVAKTDNNDNRKLVRKGDFVINSRSDRKGSSGYSTLDGSVSVINTVLKLRNLFPKYSDYLFKSYEFIEEFFRNGKGIVMDLWSTRYSEMKGMLIPIPTLPEQQSIVAFLDDKTSQIDSLISNSQQKIELLKEKRTALINHAVTKGLNPKAKMKDSGVEWIGEIPEGWYLLKLKHVSVYKNGCSFKADDFDIENEIPVIRIGDISDEINFDLCVKLPEQYIASHSEFIIKYGDILVGLTGGTIGKTGRFLFSNTALLNQRVGLLRGNHLMSTDYLNKYVKSDVFIKFIFFKCYGGSQDNIGRDDLLSFVVPTPSISEQQEIVEYLDHHTTEIDKEVSLEQKRIELLKEYRQSLISEVVTGKINVSDYAVQSN